AHVDQQIRQQLTGLLVAEIVHQLPSAAQSVLPAQEGVVLFGTHEPSQEFRATESLGKGLGDCHHPPDVALRPGRIYAYLLGYLLPASKAFEHGSSVGPAQLLQPLAIASLRRLEQEALQFLRIASPCDPGAEQEVKESHVVFSPNGVGTCFSRLNVARCTSQE